MTASNTAPHDEQPHAAAIAPDALKAFHRSFPTGVTVLTSMVDRSPQGISVNAFSSVSIDPPMVLVCVSRQSSFLGVVDRTGTFAVNVLSDVQADIAMRFGRPGQDKFDGLDWTSAPAGSPWISGAVAKLEATTAKTLDVGTHRILFGAVTSLETTDGGHPLIYRGGRMFRSDGLPEAFLANTG
jgi:flavin reductase (DIM6/NTAB) family NADH-FMN oxidoreductase RutF